MYPQSSECVSGPRVLQKHVQFTFTVNASYSELLHWLGAASIGVSTMVEEHFGVNVVEFTVRISLAVSLC